MKKKSNRGFTNYEPCSFALLTALKKDNPQSKQTKKIKNKLFFCGHLKKTML